MLKKRGRRGWEGGREEGGKREKQRGGKRIEG